MYIATALHDQRRRSRKTYSGKLPPSGPRVLA